MPEVASAIPPPARGRVFAMLASTARSAFVSITNAVPSPGGYSAAMCKPATNEDDGYCSGQSAVFSSINSNYGADDLGDDLVPDEFLAPGSTAAEKPLRKQLAYSPRLAADKTAPDQGYPTIRNVEIRNVAP